MTDEQLCRYVERQLATFFPDGREPGPEFATYIATALQRLDVCLSGSVWYSRRTGRQGESPVFDHLHSDHYATFLCLLAHTVGRDGGERWLADKIYYLNKALHSLDVYHAVEIPSIFTIVHGLGTVIGRASFQDYFMVYQGCTIGGNISLDYPEFGAGVVMYSNSRVIGRSRIGDNCIIGQGAQVTDDEVPANSLVFGASPELEIRPNRRDVVRSLFGSAG